MASAPWTTRFWPYYTLDWLGKLLLTNMILQKTDELPKRFGLLHCCDQNAKWAVFQCGTLTFYRFLFLFYWNKFNLFAVPETTAQGKAPIRASKPTKWSPAVISTTFSPCTPRFWPYYMLDWLGKVAVTNKVNGKLINTKVVRPLSLLWSKCEMAGLSFMIFYLWLNFIDLLGPIRCLCLLCVIDLTKSK